LEIYQVEKRKWSKGKQRNGRRGEKGRRKVLEVIVEETAMQRQTSE
jgi:hypothetical protein